MCWPTGDFAAAHECEHMVKTPIKTKSIGMKVTEGQYADLDREALACGKTVGEWCREVILANVNGYGPKSQLAGGPEAQAIMAELVSLRTILLNVLFKHANGESLTAEEMQRLIERADVDKLKKAAERIRQNGRFNQ